MTDNTLDILVHEFNELGATAAQQVIAGDMEAATSAIEQRDEVLRKISLLNPDSVPLKNTSGESILKCALEQTKNDIRALKRARQLSGKLFA